MGEIPDFTVVVALDANHAAEFAETLRSWKHFRPELWRRPWVLLCDREGLLSYFAPLNLLVSPNTRVVPVSNVCGLSQRDFMLGSLVTELPRHIDTPYWLKFDSHTIATSSDQWLFTEDFQHTPGIVAPPWGYTKPALWIDRLDNWASIVPGLQNYDLPVNVSDCKISYRGGIPRLHHPRIASWIGFFNTAMTKRLCEPCRNEMPVPSQDTVHWYCAARMGLPIVRRRFQKHGWKHVLGGVNKVRKAVDEAINGV